jgi:hypothetical protein
MMLRAPSSVTMARYYRVPEPSWISQQWEKLPYNRLELSFLAAVLLFLVAAVPALLLGLYLAVQHNRMFLFLNLHGEHIEGKGIGLLRAASVIFIVFGKSNWVAPLVSYGNGSPGSGIQFVQFLGACIAQAGTVADSHEECEFEPCTEALHKIGIRHSW